jgi:DNA repair exonuclease SbcCD ATPase subunit
MIRDNVKIIALEVENLKRVVAVSLDCSGRSLTVIGGGNGQGKTSILDGIMWALGGDKFRPSNAVHDGAEEAYIKVSLDNGVEVERKGKNGSLKVTSSTGKGGQALINEFVSQFALDLPKFMGATAIDKAKLLLDVFPGLGPELKRLNSEAKRIFDERHALGVIADRKAKYAEELPFDFDAPAMPLSGAEMAKRMQDALSHNARNQGIRQSVTQAEEAVKAALYRRESIEKRVKDLEEALAATNKELFHALRERDQVQAALDSAKASTATLKDMDTTAIEKELETIDAANARCRVNESKRLAEAESSELRGQYNAATAALEEVRAQRIKLLAGVEMPMAGLSLGEEGQLIFKGQPWDCMSGAEQLRVSAAICSAINPKCGFVLLDKLEAMDVDSLREFGEWLDERNLQAIGTRVSTGDECSIVVVDGNIEKEMVF